MKRGPKVPDIRICKECGKTEYETKFETGRDTCIECRNAKRRHNHENYYELSRKNKRKKDVAERMSKLDQMAAEANRRGISYGQLQVEETNEMLRRMKRQMS